MMYNLLNINIIYKLFGVWLCVTFATGFVSAQDDYTIRKIDIVGNRHFGKSELLGQTSLREVNWFQRLIQKKTPAAYHAEFVEQDITRLVRFYQSEGFLFASVHLGEVAKNDKKRQVRLQIIVEENRPVRLKNIILEIRDSLNNAGLDSLQRSMKRKMSLHAGGRFRDALVYNDLQTINQVCRNRGFVYAKSDFQVKLYPDSSRVDITYIVSPGKRCEFGVTTIAGNKYVPEKLIRRQLAYKEDQQYSTRALDNTRQYLYNLKLFRVVSVVPESDNTTQINPVPIAIHLQELPRWTTKFGVGYGTDEKFRAFADITYLGIGGGNSRLNLNVKYSSLVPYNFDLKWIQPQFLLRNLSLTVNPYILKQDEPGFETRTLGLNVPFIYTVNGDLTLAVTLYKEIVKQYAIDSISGQVDEDNLTKHYHKSGIYATLAYKTARPVFFPTKGMAFSFGAKLNGTLFGGDYDYIKLWMDVRKYLSIGSGFVLAGRMTVGSIPSFNTVAFIPVEDRFYSGGSTSIRGWAYSELGPKREDGTPEGGSSLLEMSVEMRHHLFWRLDGVLFTDAGNVWTNSFHYPIDDLAYAMGGGLRFDTPIGPIRLDVAVPVWNQKKKMQFFINIGQAF